MQLNIRIVFQVETQLKAVFSNFSCMFVNPNIFSNLNLNCSNLLDMRNLQEQVKKAFCYQWYFFTKIVLTFHCLNKSLKQAVKGQKNFW